MRALSRCRHGIETVRCFVRKVTQALPCWIDSRKLSVDVTVGGVWGLPSVLLFVVTAKACTLVISAVMQMEERRTRTPDPTTTRRCCRRSRSDAGSLRSCDRRVATPDFGLGARPKEAVYGRASFSAFSSTNSARRRSSGWRGGLRREGSSAPVTARNTTRTPWHNLAHSLRTLANTGWLSENRLRIRDSSQTRTRWLQAALYQNVIMLANILRSLPVLGV